MSMTGFTVPRVMLASPGHRIPIGSQWLHEVKHDGYRCLVCVGRTVRLFTRHGNELTSNFPELMQLNDLLQAPMWLDGELVVPVQNGRGDFYALQKRVNTQHPDKVGELAVQLPAVVVVFYCLEAGGRRLITHPIEERKAQLDQRVVHGPGVLVNPVFDDGNQLFSQVVAGGHEGVVSKRKGSVYRPGVRSQDWVKVKAWRTIAAELVGANRKGGLQYVAWVDGKRTQGAIPYGMGMGKVDRVILCTLIERYGKQTDMHWRLPCIPIYIRHTGVALSGRLRDTSFGGWRVEEV